ncbi:hypothetical protein [Roseivirga echinicomitans]|uniref:Outer membrane protein beta-barrel domain-containing protein n=1 Tax=Roseivirga echinicomitans TaxID=296218 RepID=A0A150XNE0_9BACT|nr:hypothetical protein [Roseivirga echinicomitans]KYG80223.1 hypothetical protein AWN68_17120 [Roseivirga echinicomitans]
MKKLLAITFLLLVSNTVFSQTYHQAKEGNSFTFQVAPTYFNYGGYLFGYQIGINFKEVFNISYFHTRDYDFGERYMDDRFAGIQSSVMLPIGDNMQIGPSVRLAKYNSEAQKVFIAAEARVDLNESWKLGFEYGVGEKRGFGLKFIWNLN